MELQLSATGTCAPSVTKRVPFEEIPPHSCTRDVLTQTRFSAVCACGNVTMPNKMEFKEVLASIKWQVTAGSASMFMEVHIKTELMTVTCWTLALASSIFGLCSAIALTEQKDISRWSVVTFCMFHLFE